MSSRFKLSLGVIAVVLIGSVVPVIASNPATITVTVTIQNVSVSASGPIAFGTVASGSATVAAGAATLTNDGNVAETYSLNLTNPAGWTAVQAAPGAEEYVLSAKFNVAAPTSGSFTYADHALTTTPVTCTGTRFAGDQTGVSVAASATRNLWLKFEAPSSTSVTTQQSITVTVTAAAS